MAAHLLYQDFLCFLHALPAGTADPWELYRELYLDRNRAALEAWWDQCIGQPLAVWQDRVRRVRPQDYSILADVVQEADLAAVAADALARCRRQVAMSPEPEVYYLVGFFSPEGFAFQVEGRWAIGIGMERLGSLRLVPVLLAHEYAHCFRRSLGSARTLGERLVDEGFAVELSARAFPERPSHDWLLMRPGQVVALRRYEGQLWQAIEPFLGSADEALAGRVLYGQGTEREWPSRSGLYLGWRLVQRFLGREPSRFDAAAAAVLAARQPAQAGRQT